MPACPPRRESIAGTFKAGELRVGEKTYADAICGLPLCGDAICGTWWVEPCEIGLGFGGYAPSILAPTVQAPAAGLALGANLPALIIQDEVDVVPAGLGLGASLPSLHISPTFRPQAAGLAFGTYPATFIGWERLTPAECIDRDLLVAACSDLDLVPAACD